MTPSEEFRQQVAEMAAGERWIIDGTFMSSLDLRLPRAEGVIFLDFPTLICLRRILQRVFEYGKSPRPDMAKGCNERLDMEFIRYTFTFRCKIRPGLVDRISTYYRGSSLIELKSPAAVSDFLEHLKSGH